MCLEGVTRFQIRNTVSIFLGSKLAKFAIKHVIEYGIFGEGSHISTNQKREITVFSLLIGRNMRPFPENTVLYRMGSEETLNEKGCESESECWFNY